MSIGGFVREAVGAGRALMKPEISAEVGAELGEVAPEARATYGNGYRPWPGSGPYGLGGGGRLIRLAVQYVCARGHRRYTTHRRATGRQAVHPRRSPGREATPASRKRPQKARTGTVGSIRRAYATAKTVSVQLVRGT